MSTTPIKNEAGDEVLKSSPSKSATPSKDVPQVTTRASPVEDSGNLLDPAVLTVDTGPTPPITPDRDSVADKPTEESKKAESSSKQSPEKLRNSEEQISDGQSPGSKKGRKNHSQQSSPKSPREVSKENQDPVKEGEAKKEARGSESEKAADATSTTSTGGVPTSGSEDITGKVRVKRPHQRPWKKDRDGGLRHPPGRDNLERFKTPTEGGEVKEGGEDVPVDGEGTAVKNESQGQGNRGYGRNRGRGRGYPRGARPGFFPAQKTQPRVVNTVKSGDESAPDADKKVTTSEGGPTEGSGSGTETEKPVPRRRNRNKNRPRRRKSGNREEGEQDGGQSDTQNGYSSQGENRESKSGAVEVKAAAPRNRRPRGPRGPPRDDQSHNKERRDSDPEVAVDSQQPRRDGYGGRGRGWRPRGSSGFFGGGRGRGGWNNDNKFGERRVGDRYHDDRRQVDRRQDDRRQDDRRQDDRRQDDRRQDDRRQDDRSDNVFRESNNSSRDRPPRDDDQRPVGGYQRRDNFHRNDDTRSSYPGGGGGGYPARSYGNSNFGRGGSNFSGESNYGGGGYRGRGGFRGGYMGNRSGGTGFNSPRGSGRQYGNQSDNHRYSAQRPHNNFSNDGSTPIDVKGLPGQQPSSVTNTHTGGFWNP